jgi:hypothetical protein
LRLEKSRNWGTVRKYARSTKFQPVQVAAVKQAQHLAEYRVAATPMNGGANGLARRQGHAATVERAFVFR